MKINLGAAGEIIDASFRNTVEINLQKIVLYLRKKEHGLGPGENELESKNRPAGIGSELVMPGHVSAAGGDGVVVVPRKVDKQVEGYAHTILKQQKAERRILQKIPGRPLDRTVK